MGRHVGLVVVVVASVLASFGLEGCRLLGIDTSVPCNGNQDCAPPAVCGPHVAGTTGVCTTASAGEGEGEGVAAGEGEGAPGEGEGGSVGEGEGEGEGPPPEQHLVDVTPTRDAPVDDAIENHAAVFTVDATDCTGPCVTVAGPDGRTAIGAALTKIGAPAIPGATMVLEAVLDLPPQSDLPSSPVPLFSIVDDGNGGSIAANLEADAAGDIDLVLHFASASGPSPAPDLIARRHLGVVARGWAHVLCALDNGAGANAFAHAQCFMNSERFAIESTGTFAPSTSAASATVTVNVPALSIATWDAGTYASILAAFAGASSDVQLQQDAFAIEARLRLAAWAGVPASSQPLPSVAGQPALSSLIPLFPGASSEIEMRDGALGPVSVVNDVGADPNAPAVTWLMPGWPRVIVDAGSGQPALLLEQTRTSLVGNTSSTFNSGAMACSLVPGPSGDANNDAESCTNGTASLPVGGSGPRVASILAQVASAGATASATFGACTYALTATSATPQPATCAAAEELAPTKPGQPSWFRLSAPVAGSATSVALGVAAGNTVVFALPSAEAATTATTPLVPGTAAHADAIVYPIPEVAASGVEFTARLDALDAQTAGALATFVKNGQPVHQIQLFVQNGSLALDDGASAQPATTLLQPGVRYDARFDVATPVATCPVCTPLSFLPTTSIDATAAAFVVGGALTQNNQGALAANVTALEQLTLDVVTGTPSAEPRDVSLAFTGIAPGGVATVPAPAGVTFGAPVSSFDAQAGQNASTGFPACENTPVFTPAPTTPASSAFFPVGNGCRVYVSGQTPSLGTGRLLVDALFQVVPGNSDQRIAGYQGPNNRRLAIDVPAASTTPAGTLTTIRVSDASHSVDLVPPPTAQAPQIGFDGWAYLACVIEGGAGDPVCTVNMLAVDDVEEPNASADVAEKAEIGADTGTDSSTAKGPIAFVHVWTVPSALAAADERALVTTLAQTFFGVAQASSPSSPSSLSTSYERGAIATTLLLDKSGAYQAFDVARDFPRTAVVDAAATHAGFLAEPERQNYLRAAIDPVLGATWTRTGTVAGAGGQIGPRPTGQIATVSALASIAQDLGAPADAFVEPAANGSYDVAASVWVHGGRPELRINVKPQGGGLLTFIGTLETVTGTCTSSTATCVVTSPDSFGWRRLSLLAQVPADATSVAFKLTNLDGSVDLLMTAPQLEVGAFATSYMPTIITGGERRPADDLAVALDGPVAFSGTLDVAATVPAGLPASAEAVLASVTSGTDVGLLASGAPFFRPALDWQNGTLAFPEPRALSADFGQSTEAATLVGASGRFHALGTWRHGTATLALITSGASSTKLQAATSSDLVPPRALVVGALGPSSFAPASSSPLPCGACAVGETIEAVTLHLDAP